MTIESPRRAVDERLAFLEGVLQEREAHADGEGIGPPTSLQAGRPVEARIADLERGFERLRHRRD